MLPGSEEEISCGRALHLIIQEKFISVEVLFIDNESKHMDDESWKVHASRTHRVLWLQCLIIFCQFNLFGTLATIHYPKKKKKKNDSFHGYYQSLVSCGFLLCDSSLLFPSQHLSTFARNKF